MDQSQSPALQTQADSPRSPSCLPHEKCVSGRTLALFVMISLLIGAGSVYFWYEPFVHDSKKILMGHISVIEAQRDEVLLQRKLMKGELDTYKAAVVELGHAEEVEKFLAEPEKEASEE